MEMVGRKSSDMNFDEKITILLKRIRQDNERFDFSSMGVYVDGTYNLEDLKRINGLDYTPGSFAMLYAEQVLRPILGEMFESNQIQMTEEIEKQVNKKVNDCWQEGFPLYKWRKEKICYCFNQVLSRTLLEQLENSDGNVLRLPGIVLANVPNSCAFITTDGEIFGSEYKFYTYGNDKYEIIGFIYTIDKNLNGDAILIDICPVVTQNKEFFVIENYYMLLPIDRDVTLGEAVGTAYQYCRELDNPNSQFINNIKKYGGPALEAALQYILYLCSDEAEILQSETNLRTYRKADPNNIKDKYREVLRYDVGNEIGQLLAKKEEKLVSTSIHLRRAHWHHRWVGQRNTDKRRLVLKWQRPSIVHRKCKAWSELGEEIIKAEGEADYYWEIEVVNDIKINDFVEYQDRPLPKPQKPLGIGTAYTYFRNKRIACNAMLHAKYQCELDKEHSTFIRKSNGSPYVEPHHLVPMAFQDDFDVSLDREQNIVALCCNCHRRIHYGIEREIMLRKLYDIRKAVLEEVGIEITVDELLQMYQ